MPGFDPAAPSQNEPMKSHFAYRGWWPLGLWFGVPLLFVALIFLSGCVGLEFEQRGWRVRGFAAAPLETPLVEHHTRVIQRQPDYAPPRIVERWRSSPPQIVYRDRWRDRYREREPRIVYRDRVRHRTVRESCKPPYKLMFQSPYFNPDQTRRFRDLQRWVKANCG